MKDFKEQLAEGDPVAHEGELNSSEARIVRQRMLVEARSGSPPPRAWWLGPLALAGAIAACLMLAIGIGMRIDGHGSASPASVNRPAAERDRGRTQLQFATSGGTRIIWTFHEHLDL